MPRQSHTDEPRSRFVWEPGDVRVTAGPLSAQVRAIADAVRKFNPHHDERGRFASAEAAAAAGADSSRIDTPERNKLRASIVEKMTKGAVKGRRAFVVMGGPASGKSTLRANLLADQWQAVNADPDIAKKELPEYNDAAYANNRSTFLHEESSNINADVITHALSQGANLVIPKVGDNQDKIERLIKALDAHGYTVTLSHVDLPTEEAVKRNGQRLASGGHGPTEQYVRDVDAKPAKTYAALKSHPGVDFYEQYSSAGPPTEPTQLIERGANRRRP